MISFPLFNRLKVDGYGLYPGPDDKSGLSVDFAPGLTLVLGANGLGKSTLVLLLYRLCSGTQDLSNLPQGNLGDRQFSLSRLSLDAQRAFAARVHDNASKAYAELEFLVGEHRIEVTRRLDTLALEVLLVDGEAREPSETSFQAAVSSASGLTSFEDWLLVLRYLVFYFDDRRSLVWDQNAQRQILRMLFLPPADSRAWTELESQTLRVDSEMRNLRAIVSRFETKLVKDENRLESSPQTQQQLASLTEAQERDEEELEAFESSLAEYDAERSQARLESLRAANDRESAYRALENERLTRLRAAFPSESESSAYLLTSLMAGNQCLACDNQVPEYAELLRLRIEQGQCVVCGSEVDHKAPSTTAGDIAELRRLLEKADVRASEANRRRRSAEKTYSELLDKIAERQSSVAARSAEIEQATKRLPDGLSDVRARRQEYSAMHANVERLRAEVDSSRATFRDHIRSVNSQILARKEDIKAAFDEFASDFLLEDISLTWSNHRARIGQGGELIEYPSFRVEMAGTDFPSAVRRTDAEHVSESQREFIDLAFRMALMRVAGTKASGSLVVDAPESSLDAVFAPRAAAVLMRFGSSSLNNRLIITSNLVDGRLIPKMLSLAKISDTSNPRVVDLFKIAAPTAAIRQHADEYREVFEQLFEGEGS